MTLFLHIGTSKTGTSAIQQILASNQARLEQQGILYPRAGRPRGRGSNAHYQLAWSIRELHGYSGIAAWESLALEAQSAGLGKIVVSSEAFSGMNQDQIRLVKGLTAQYDTTVIVYLRNPYKYLKSSYFQGVKKGRVNGRFEDFVASSLDRIDYPNLISKWASVGKIEVRVYDAVRSHLESDILALIGAVGLEIRPKPVNKTPNERTMNAIQFLNRLRLGHRLDRRIRRYLINGGPSLITHLFKSAIPEGGAKGLVDDFMGHWDAGFMLSHISSEDLCLLRA